MVMPSLHKSQDDQDFQYSLLEDASKQIRLLRIRADHENDEIVYTLCWFTLDSAPPYAAYPIPGARSNQYGACSSTVNLSSSVRIVGRHCGKRARTV